ncbi:MAG TPA: ATP-binding protein [Acidimicrobiia bacterium]|nr:ATP-binding protein [Acidimicrobiia bacterium]
MSSGKLKVFLGAAPGVGKTYAMLEEGHRLRSEGRDVVVGFVESHDRADTAAIVGDLEVIPRRFVGDDDIGVEEMDTAAVVARRPEVALVDELAHSNAEGPGNAKRWQDVAELLDAGIDVMSTVNIQHLDSLNDVISEITDVPQLETIPDEILRRADEIELVDLTQEGIRERFAAGKIYPAERVDAALADYFRAGNLGALRELALSWTAERVDEAVANYRELHGIEQTWETRERVIVGLSGAEGADSVLRRAGRLAMRSRADLIGVYVRPTRGTSDVSDRTLSTQRELLHRLGGTYHEVVGDDVGTSLIGFARGENATQIVVGATRRSRVDELLRGSPVSEVIRNAGDIDVHVISHLGTRRRERGPRAMGMPAISRVRQVISWGIALVGLPLLTWLLVERRDAIALYNVLLVYLLLAVTTGGVGGALPAVTTATAGFLLANWFFTEPLGTWAISSPDDLFSLFAFLSVSLAVGMLVGYSSRRSAEARRARAQAEALASTTSLGHPVFASDLQAHLRRVRDALSLDAVSLLRRIGGSWVTLAWEGREELTDPSEGSESIDLTDDMVLVIRGGRLTVDDLIVLRAFAVQMAQLVERAELKRDAAMAEAMAEADRLRTALLSAVSHDLRTPLATIKASLTSLIETGVDWTPEQTRSFVETALEETERLNRLVGHLLDASRVQAGAVHVFVRPVGLDEVVSAALAGVRSGAGRITIDISESLPDVETDPDLLERVVANLIDNALTWSPEDRAVTVTAGEVAGRIDLRVVDRGPGISPAERETVLLPFQQAGDSPNRDGVGLGLAVSHGLLQAMGNELVIEETPGGGTTMVIALKVARPDLTPVGELARRG